MTVPNVHMCNSKKFGPRWLGCCAGGWLASAFINLGYGPASRRFRMHGPGALPAPSPQGIVETHHTQRSEKESLRTHLDRAMPTTSQRTPSHSSREFFTREKLSAEIGNPSGDRAGLCLLVRRPGLPVLRAGTTIHVTRSWPVNSTILT